LEQKSLIISLIAALSIIIFLVLIVVFSSMRSKTQVKRKVISKKGKDNKKKFTIKDMVEIAANRNSSKNDLTNAIIKVTKEFIFPSKIQGVTSNEAKVYLDFILLVASHKKSDAKLIAFMSTEIKKVNKDYSKEIDIYENEGLRQRAKRI